MNRPHQRRRIAFLVLCIGCIAAIVIYGLLTLRSHRAPGSAGAPQPPAAETATPGPNVTEHVGFVMKGGVVYKKQ